MEGRQEGAALRVLAIGAHPDDCDFTAGGLAALYAERGHCVQMLSLTNGDAGHHEMGGAPLAWRRRAEAEAAGRILGVGYTVLDHHDGELMPDLPTRREVIAAIRRFAPDLVLGPRQWDYHPDHRAAAQLMMDAMYLLTVPNVVSDVPHLRRMPVCALVADGFQHPEPFAADVVVDVDAAVERKIDALACHASQVYEWLPYNRNELARVPAGAAERRVWLGDWYRQMAAPQAEEYRAALVARYGVARGGRVRFVEALAISEYGAQPTAEEIERLFPF